MTPKENHLILLLVGILIGFMPNSLSFCYRIYVSSHISVLVVGIVSEIVLISLSVYLWNTVKALRKTTHKARIVFFGISLVSFFHTLELKRLPRE